MNFNEKEMKERENFEKVINDLDNEASKKLLKVLYSRIEEGAIREHKRERKRKVILAALSATALLALGSFGAKKGYDYIKENVSIEFENPVDEELANTVSANNPNTVSSNNPNTVSSNDGKLEEETEEKENIRC